MNAPALAAAAAATLAAGPCRVRETHSGEPAPPGEWNLGVVHEGVADLARGLTRFSATDLGSGWETIAEKLRTRFPWLDEDDDDDHASAEHVVGPDPVTGLRRPVDPLRIVELLRAAGGPAGRFRLDPSGGGAAIEGEAWLDDAGRLARVRWTQNQRARPRSPFRPRIEGPRPWRTLELWDYGLDVAIDPPQPDPEESWAGILVGLWRTGHELRGRKREWEARHGR